MKGQDCKFPISENCPSLFHNENPESFLKHKKLLISAWFLVLIIMSIMIGFTFRSLNEISELREEVENLKASLQFLDKKFSDLDNRKYTDDHILLEENHHYDDDYYEFSYDDDDSEDLYEDDNDIFPEKIDLLTGEDFTKDVKTTTPPRSKRSIIGYTQDGIPINSDSHEEQRRKNITRKSITSAPTRKDEMLNLPLTAEEQISSGRTKHRQRRLELDDRSVRYGRMRPLPAAHFNGDTSKYVLGQHENFAGNGRLKHPQRIFVDWTESSWFQTLDMDRYFSFSDGILTLKESGLYFIYAQIFYYDVHDINGFRVYRNETDTLLQCTTMTHSNISLMKGNTCFTAAAEYLQENDRISLGDLSEARYSLFEPGKSFFGVIKIGDVKIPKRK